MAEVNKNPFEIRLETLKMANHHLRLLLQHRHSAEGQITTTGKKKKLRPLTDKDFELACIPEAARRHPKSRPRTDPENDAKMMPKWNPKGPQKICGPAFTAHFGSFL